MTEDFSRNLTNLLFFSNPLLHFQTRFILVFRRHHYHHYRFSFRANALKWVPPNWVGVQYMWKEAKVRTLSKATDVLIQWCRKRGCKGWKSTPNFLICRKSGNKPWKYGQNPWKSGQKGTQRSLASKNGAQRLEKNKWRRFFFWKSHQKKGLDDLSGRRFVGKSSTTRLRKFQQNPSHPPKFWCSCTYVLIRQYHSYIIWIARRPMKLLTAQRASLCAIMQCRHLGANFNIPLYFVRLIFSVASKSS